MPLSFSSIAGALIILLKSHRLPVPPLELHKLRKSVIYFAAINLVLGLAISFGTMVAHSGLNLALHGLGAAEAVTPGYWVEVFHHLIGLSCAAFLGMERFEVIASDIDRNRLDVAQHRLFGMLLGKL